MKPRLITISIVYTTPGSDQVWISGDAYLVQDEDELKAICDCLATRYSKDGSQILNALFVEASESLILAAAKKLKEKE